MWKKFSTRSTWLISSAIAIVDTGPLFAATDSRDKNHTRSLEALERPDLSLVLPGLVVQETLFMIGRLLGPAAEAGVARELRQLDIEMPTPEDWDRIADLIEQYADFPLGSVDASIIALAERFGAQTIITLDRRHFGAVRPRHVEAFEILPA